VQHFAQLLDQWETTELYTNNYLYLIWVILGLKRESDGSPSPLPNIKEMGKQNLGSAIYILFMYCLLDVLAFTFGFHQISSPPVCVRDQDFLDNITENDYLQVYIIQYINNELVLTTIPQIKKHILNDWVTVVQSLSASTYPQTSSAESSMLVLPSCLDVAESTKNELTLVNVFHSKNKYIHWENVLQNLEVFAMILLAMLNVGSSMIQ